jgi:hypothetical protein
MMRYRLRTLLILLTILPPILAVVAPHLAQLLVKEPQFVRAVSNSRPVFTSYYLKFIDPAVAHRVISTKLASQPNLQVMPDRRLGALHVVAQPENQAAIQAILNSLDQPSPLTPPATP